MLPSSTAPTPASSNRLDRVRTLLVEIFEDLSGKDLSALDGAPTFLELGFDSLFLTQVTQAVQEKVGVNSINMLLRADRCLLGAGAVF